MNNKETQVERIGLFIGIKNKFTELENAYRQNDRDGCTQAPKNMIKLLNKFIKTFDG